MRQVRDAIEHPLEKAFREVPPAPSKLRTVLQALCLGLAYIAISAGMIMYNKFMMKRDVFPFAVTLTSIHQLSSLMLAMVLRQIAPSLFPSVPIVFGQVGAQKLVDGELVFGQGFLEFQSQTLMDRFKELLYALLPFSSIAVCGAVSLVAGNSAYQHASVAFLQMVKESQIVFVYMFMLVAGLEIFRFRLAMVLAGVAVSATVAVCGEVYFSRTGLTLQVVAGVCGSAQIVLNNHLMSQSAGPKIDPLTMVMCTAPCMLVVLLPANFLFWDPEIPFLALEWAPYIISNAMLAFALQVATAMLIKSVSGTGFALACVAKDLAIVAAAAFLLHEHLSFLQVCGFAGSIIGMSLYSAMKIYPAAFEPSKATKEDKEASDNSSSCSSSSTRTGSPYSSSAEGREHLRRAIGETARL